MRTVKMEITTEYGRFVEATIGGNAIELPWRQVSQRRKIATVRVMVDDLMTSEATVKRALTEAGGRVERAARDLGIPPVVLYRSLHKGGNLEHLGKFLDGLRKARRKGKAKNGG